MRTEIVVVLVVLAAVGIAASFLRSTRSSAEEVKTQKTVFVFVKVPESIMPAVRAEKYEKPLDAALKREKLGEVTGGGSQLSEPDAQGRGTVEWVGLDVELIELERGLTFIKKELLRLGAPSETTLEFKRAGNRTVESITN